MKRLTTFGSALLAFGVAVSPPAIGDESSKDAIKMIQDMAHLEHVLLCQTG